LEDQHSDYITKSLKETMFKTIYQVFML